MFLTICLILLGCYVGSKSVSLSPIYIKAKHQTLQNMSNAYRIQQTTGCDPPIPPLGGIYRGIFIPEPNSSTGGGSSVTINRGTSRSSYGNSASNGYNQRLINIEMKLIFIKDAKHMGGWRIKGTGTTTTTITIEDGFVSSGSKGTTRNSEYADVAISSTVEQPCYWLHTYGSDTNNNGSNNDSHIKEGEIFVGHFTTNGGFGNSFVGILHNPSQGIHGKFTLDRVEDMQPGERRTTDLHLPPVIPVPPKDSFKQHHNHMTTSIPSSEAGPPPAVTDSDRQGDADSASPTATTTSSSSSPSSSKQTNNKEQAEKQRRRELRKQRREKENRVKQQNLHPEEVELRQIV